MRALPAALRRSADGLLAVLLAPRCLACDLPLDAPTGGPVCAACWRDMAPISPPVCQRCGEALPVPPSTPDPVNLCCRCRRSPRGAVTVGRSAATYDGTLRRLVHALKYEGRRSLAPRLAALMRQRGEEVLSGADLAVPVPLHWRRRWGRGFNQAEDLAAHLGLPVCRALVRTRATPAQFGLPAARRRRNVRGAFAPRWRRRFLVWGERPASRVKGKVVVLVDDLATTGATLESCGLVLRQLGAREVRAVTAGRAPRPRPRPR